MSEPRLRSAVGVRLRCRYFFRLHRLSGNSSLVGTELSGNKAKWERPSGNSAKWEQLVGLRLRCRYFFRLHRLHEEEDRRLALLKRAATSVRDARYK